MRFNEEEKIKKDKGDNNTLEGLVDLGIGLHCTCSSLNFLVGGNMDLSNSCNGDNCSLNMKS